jgi:hypothetical protein
MREMVLSILPEFLGVRLLGPFPDWHFHKAQNWGAIIFSLILQLEA